MEARRWAHSWLPARPHWQQSGGAEEQERKKQLHVAEALVQISGGVPMLNLTGKQLCDSGVTRLAEALSINNAIVCLHLDGNGIGDMGATTGMVGFAKSAVSVMQSPPGTCRKGMVHPQRNSP